MIVILMAARHKQDRALHDGVRPRAGIGLQVGLNRRIGRHKGRHKVLGKSGFFRIAFDPSAGGPIELGSIRKTSQIPGNQRTIHFCLMSELPVADDVQNDSHTS